MGARGGVIAAHADWSVDPRKRWLAVACPAGPGWVMGVEPVGEVSTLLARLRARAGGGAVALGVDFPIGVPRAFAALHAGGTADFPALLRGMAPGFLEVASTLDEVGPGRPFYPRRGVQGMTRLSHAQALGMAGAAGLSRACDRATANRPAGAPVFWTLGANQSGKAAISAWRDVLRPALARAEDMALWPFEGALLGLLRPGRVVVAETYPADALRQIGLRPIGSKRRQADRRLLSPGVAGAMAGLGVTADAGLAGWLADGFGADAAGEDRLDCVLGCLCVLMVLAGRRPDAAPDDEAVRRWEGWVLGQA